MCKSNIVRNKRNCDGINVMCKSKEEYLCSAYTLHRAVRRSKFQLVLHRFSQKNNKKEKKRNMEFSQHSSARCAPPSFDFCFGGPFQFRKKFCSPQEAHRASMGWAPPYDNHPVGPTPARPPKNQSWPQAQEGRD